MSALPENYQEPKTDDSHFDIDATSTPVGDNLYNVLIEIAITDPFGNVKRSSAVHADVQAKDGDEANRLVLVRIALANIKTAPDFARIIAREVQP